MFANGDNLFIVNNSNNKKNQFENERVGLTNALTEKQHMALVVLNDTLYKM